MSSDDSSHAPASRDRREAVREKALQVKAQQSRARLIRRSILGIALAAVVALVVGAVVWTVASNVSRPTLAPTNVQDDGFVVTEALGVAGVAPAPDDTEATAPAEEGTPAAETAAPAETPDASAATAQPAVDIRVYVDYLSEGSRTFQLSNVQQLASWVNQGAAHVTYYPVAMLTAKSNGTKYSLRAASAAACVATHSPDWFFAYNNALLTEQPPVDSDGHSDADLADLALAAGAGEAKKVRSCIESESFASWARAATDRALDEIPSTDGIALTGTPMVLVNGQPYVGALDDAAEFSQFVLTVASDAYYEATPSPTPTATPTP